MQELIDIISEAPSIMDPENRFEQTTQDALYRAATKIRKMRDTGSGSTLTPPEKAAIKYALEDVGELHLFAGTSAGFDVEAGAQKEGHQSKGQKARGQAAALRIYL